MKSAVKVPCSRAQSARKLLETHGLWDKTRKLQKHDGDSVLIPVNTADASLLAHHLHAAGDSFSVVQVDLPSSRSERLVTPAQQLRTAVFQMVDQCNSLAASRERLLREVPNHWEKHGDLVLLPPLAFVSAEWSLLGQELWQTVAECTRASRVARQSVVSADGFRTPQVVLLLGDHAVVQHVDNAITYEYDLTRCMFSAGNVTEKLRIAKFNCTGETVVDLYAGIGYFTLPYLVHAGASHVHACEWNPDAVAALRRNLELNRMDGRCTVHHGDNRQMKLKGIADRVNLGLIPSSEEGWPVACRVLKPSGGVLHVHGNVNTQTGQGERHPVPHAPDASPAVGTEQMCQQSSLHPVEKEPAAEAARQSWTRTVCLHGESEEVPTSSQTLQGKKCEMPSEMTGQTNKSCVRQEDSMFPLQAADIVESYASHSAKRFENEEEQLVGDTSEKGTSSQKNHILPADSSLDTNTLTCPEINQEPSNTCSSCPLHPNAQPHTTYDMDGSNLESGSNSARNCQSFATLNSSIIQEQCDAAACNKMSPCRSKAAAWQRWGDYVCDSLEALLQREHAGCWCVSVGHIEPVKSYAPHVQHIVLDVHCTPVTPASNSDYGVP